MCYIEECFYQKIAFISYLIYISITLLITNLIILIISKGKVKYVTICSSLFFLIPAIYMLIVKFSPFARVLISDSESDFSFAYKTIGFVGGGFSFILLLLLILFISVAVSSISISVYRIFTLPKTT